MNTFPAAILKFKSPRSTAITHSNCHSEARVTREARLVERGCMPGSMLAAL
jgi:hypothetical protein